MIMKILRSWPHRGKEQKCRFSTALWIEWEWEGLCSNSLSCAQLGRLAPIPQCLFRALCSVLSMVQGWVNFTLKAFKVSIWHLWLHLQFKLVYFLLFSFYSTEFSACERCWIVISGDWNLFIYPCNRYTLSSGNVILPLSNTTPSRVPDAEELSLRSENNGQFSCSCSSIND